MERKKRMVTSEVRIAEAALMQRALIFRGQGSGFGTSETFESLFSNALINAQNAFGSQGTHTNTFDMYSELMAQPASQPGALFSALVRAGGGMSTMALLGLYSTLNSRLSAAPPVKAGEGKVTQRPWIKSHPAITSGVRSRSPELYKSVIDQFKVETNPRYSPEQGGTYCNIFVWDVTSAMGAEIPHYYDAKTGEPMKRGQEGASQMNANGIYKWLHKHGREYGWFEVSPEQAQNLANQGHPVVTALYRKGTHGHVQVVCPSKNGAYDSKRGVTVAQAGRRLRDYTYITNIYNASLPKVSYFAHI